MYRKRKFILGLDLDNVTLLYNDAMQKIVSEKFGVPPEVLADPKFYSFVQSGWPFKDEAHFRQVHGEAVEAGLYTALKPMEGVSEALHELVDAGVGIHVITSRFVNPGQHAKVICETAMSLENHNIPFDNIAFQDDKTRILADVYLDDSPANILALRRAGRHAVVYDASFNRDLPGPRVNNWIEAKEYILDLVKVYDTVL